MLHAMLGQSARTCTHTHTCIHAHAAVDACMHTPAAAQELLDYLSVSDAEFKPDLTAKICTLIQRYARTHAACLNLELPCLACKTPATAPMNCL